MYKGLISGNIYFSFQIQLDVVLEASTMLDLYVTGNET